MLFRPSYCAHCGEKIERAEWHIWTSRRFCELCAIEFRGTDLLPKAAVVVGVFGIVLAVSGYVDRGQATAKPVAARQTLGLVDRPEVTTNSGPSTALSGEPKQPPKAPTSEAPPLTAPQPAASRPPAVSQEKLDGPVYICGAQTKKGTPCSRRVKGNVRCFQHTGMPAMLPPEKLRVG